MPGYPLRVLIGEEILGRVSGTGAEASGRSSWQILLGLWKLPVHFTLRTLPLSIFGILAWRSLPRHDWAALLVWFVLLNFLVFGFSASRRADWMMPAVPALAAFAATRWCVNWKYPLGTSVGICGLGFLLMSVNEIKNAMPWSDQIEEFAGSARKAIHAEPAPVLVIGNDRNHLVGLLGLSDIDRQGPTSLESLEQWLDSSVEPGAGFGLWLEIERLLEPDRLNCQWKASALGINWTARFSGAFRLRRAQVNTCGQGRSGWVGLGVDNEAKAPLGPIVHCAHHCDRESERRMWQDHHCHPVGR